MRRSAHQNVGLLIGLTGLIEYITNIVMIHIFLIPHTITLKIIPYRIVWYLLLVFLSLIKQENLIVRAAGKSFVIHVQRIHKYIQFLFFIYMFTIIIISEDSGNFLSVPVIFLSGLLGIRYNILTQKTLLILIIYSSIITEAVALIHGEMFTGFFMILFSLLFFGILSLLFFDRNERELELVKKYHKKVVDIEEKYRLLHGDSVNPLLLGLTVREMEVLRILCLGYNSNQEIATELGLKVQTIKTHLSNIFDKVGVDDRYQLIDLCRLYFLQEALDEHKKQSN